GLNARDRIHRPLRRVHAIENSQAAEALRRVDDHQLRGRRSHVVSDDGRARQTQPIEKLQHPPSLARHVDMHDGRSLGIAVTDEVRNDYAIPGADQERRDARPEVTGGWKAVQQKKREAFPFVFETHGDVTDLDAVGQTALRLGGPERSKYIDVIANEPVRATG